LNKSTSIFGVRITRITLEELLQRLEHLFSNGDRAIITHVHVTGLNIAFNHPWFREFLNAAQINYCDGMGVKLASHILGNPLPERYTLVDWLPQLAEISVRQNKSWYFLGNNSGSADRAAEIIKEKFPLLSIKGTHHGFFNLSSQHPDTNNLIKEINDLKPDVLFIGLGMPNQEKWLLDNWDHLEVQIAITCGGTFDTLAGINKRGPSWMTQNYLEWLSRLIYSPRKYWQRYVRDIPLFLFRVILQKISG
jgi:N-acetylglucosaminyldiphosphoundecaprenol N-acetyl-beta-D-mannosaminyltransferase